MFKMHVVTGDRRGAAFHYCLERLTLLGAGDPVMKRGSSQDMICCLLRSISGKQEEHKILSHFTFLMKRNHYMLSFNFQHDL